ncbi:MAG: LysR family transcriptional regulator [Pyramidobacter sp.]|nr:LysR family transcriptional regulator [Pyramidobacter sp.]
MPVDKLRSFKAAAEQLNLTRAAKKLGVTQQALSSTIAKLEESYHARFFERRKPNLVLTPEGQHFYNYATRVLAGEERMTQELNEIRLHYTGVIRLGTTLTRSMTFLPQALARFTIEHPKIRLNMFVRRHHYELEKKLLDSELDVIYTPLEATLPDTFRTAVLEKGYFCLTLPRDAIEPILPRGQSAAEFAASPLAQQRELILNSGLLEHIPCVYAGAMAGRLAPRFLGRFAPGNSSIISFAESENLLSLPYAKFAAVFTYDTLAGLNVSYDEGVPDHFIYYIQAPGSPFSVSLCYPEKSGNPALPLLIKMLLELSKKRQTKPPQEFFASID